MENLINDNLFILPAPGDCFLLVLAVLNSLGIIENLSSAISFKVEKREHSLKIKLRPSSPITAKELALEQLHEENFTITKFINFLHRCKIKKIKISTRGFNFNSWPELSFVLNLLLSMAPITLFQFLIKDKEPLIIDQLSVLFYAALHSPENLVQLALSFSYCGFSLNTQEDLEKILQNAVSQAVELKQFELKSFGENVLFAKIFEGILNARRLPKSLEGLVLECESFSNKEVLARIFGFSNLEKLKIKAKKIDIDDETVMVLTQNLRLIEKLKSLHLPLRNTKVSNLSVEKLLRVKFLKMEDLMIDLAGSKVNNEAFKTLIKEKFEIFKKVEKFPFDLENTEVTDEWVQLLIYLYNKKRNGQNMDAESSDQTVIHSLQNS